MNSKLLFLLALSLFAIFGSARAQAEEIRVAVANNFLLASKALGQVYEQASGHRVQSIAASTGKLYAQIVNGAPFHVFLSADASRPRLLVEQGLGLEETRFVYALGSLALIGWGPPAPGRDCLAELKEGDMRHLAMANPKLAPYGLAARSTLQMLGLWPALRPKVVMGENISQTLLMVLSGNATLGFVAKSQVVARDDIPLGCRWDVPREMHAPLTQEAVLLTRARHLPGAAGFLAFLRGEEARGLIAELGYGLP